MKKYTHLKYDGETYTDSNKIESILKKHKMYWLIDSEFENAELELERNVVIWENGTYFSGDWYFGIWMGGTFHGKFLNGIFKDGIFKGEWVSGIDDSGKIKK